MTRATRETLARPEQGHSEQPPVTPVEQAGSGEVDDEGVEANIVRLDGATLERVLRQAGQ